jgi:hypothetical protein
MTWEFEAVAGPCEFTEGPVRAWKRKVAGDRTPTGKV